MDGQIKSQQFMTKKRDNKENKEILSSVASSVSMAEVDDDDEEMVDLGDQSISDYSETEVINL